MRSVCRRILLATTNRAVAMRTFGDGCRAALITKRLTVVTYTYADICTPRVLTKKEYDFTGSLLRETDVSYFTTASDNTNLCKQLNSIATWSDNYLNNNHHITDIPQSVTVYGPSSSLVAETKYTYDSTSLSTTSGSLGKSVVGLSVNGQPIHDDQNFGASMIYRGNPTVISQMTTSGTFITTRTNYYNILGELIQSVDGNNNPTNYDYNDVWNDSSCISTPAFAYPTTVTNPLGQVTKMTYNSCDGSVASVQDPNDIQANRSGTVYIYDGLQRTTDVAYPDGGNTQISFGGSGLPEVIATTVTASPDPNQVSSTTLDGLGRPLLSILANGAHTANGYNYIGQLCATSNPSTVTPPASGLSCTASQNGGAVGSSATDGISYPSYDSLGRVTGRINQDGSTQSWSYSGNTVTYTDEARNQWKQFHDGTGRMTEALEPSGTTTAPSLETDYAYDALNDLMSVKQWGGASGQPAANGPIIRTFNYDGLGRLLCSSNPETNSAGCPATPSSTYTPGTTAYAYDGNSNLTSKTAPAPNAPAGSTQTVTTTYNYDALNRLTLKQAPGIAYSYSYDASISTFTSANAIGRLTEASNEANASEQFSYDPMGRIKSQANTLPDFCCTPPSATGNVISAVYDLAGDLTSLTYPDSRNVTQTWDAAGHLSSSTYSSYSGQTVNYSYLSSASYSPDGSPQSMTFGNGVVNTVSANNRQQPTEISLQATANGLNQKVFDKLYCYGPATSICPVRGSGKDNGNIWAIADGLNSNRSISAYYDTLNRITNFNNGNNSMVQTYAYDPFGNMNQIAPGTSQSNLFFNANNQISNTGFLYDAAGNLIQAYFGAGVYQYFSYDAESQLVNFNNSAATYTLDAQGNRIRKNFAGTWTEYVYFNGQPIAEKNANGSWSDYILANGQRIARADTYDARIHVSGTTPGGALASWQIGVGNNYVIKSGDILCLRQYQSNGYGGPNIQFSDGTQTYGVLVDNTGQPISAFQTQVTWSDRTVNLSSFAGKTVSDYQVITDSSTPAGNYNIYYGDITIVSTDGTVISIYDGQQGATFPNVYNTGQTGLSAVEEESDLTGDAEQPMNVTAFYHGDHIGSARMVTAAGGWPISTDDFYPFGLEQGPPPDPNHYKFTGKERDAESGLDHFQFRSYASTMGRWMSPDPAGMMAADIEYPQTLNRYAYVNNNPLSFTDPLGLDCAYLNNSGSGLESFDQHSSSGECGKTGGYWVDGGLTNINVNADQGTVQLTGTNNGTDQTHASYQDTSVYVGMYQNTWTNPFGHIAMAFPGQTPVGFNPKDDAQFQKQFALHQRDARVPGAVKPQVGGQLKQTVRVPVTGMQAQMIQDAINQSTQHPGNYTLGEGNGCDCGTWAQQMLGDAGINSGSSARLPSNLMQQLQQQYPQQ